MFDQKFKFTWNLPEGNPEGILRSFGEYLGSQNNKNITCLGFLVFLDFIELLCLRSVANLSLEMEVLKHEK